MGGHFYNSQNVLFFSNKILDFQVYPVCHKVKTPLKKVIFHFLVHITVVYTL